MESAGNLGSHDIDILPRRGGGAHFGNYRLPPPAVHEARLRDDDKPA